MVCVPHDTRRPTPTPSRPSVASEAGPPRPGADERATDRAAPPDSHARRLTAVQLPEQRQRRPLRRERQRPGPRSEATPPRRAPQWKPVWVRLLLPMTRRPRRSMLGETDAGDPSGEGGPMRRSGNFTSRVAGSSAAHRKGVVRGWLAFVLVAFLLGSTVGLATLTRAEQETGQSRLADQTLAQQFPSQRAGEEGRVQNPTGDLGASGRAAVADVVARLSGVRSVASIRSPLAAANHGQISKD